MKHIKKICSMRALRNLTNYKVDIGVWNASKATMWYTALQAFSILLKVDFKSESVAQDIIKTHAPESLLQYSGLLNIGLSAALSYRVYSTRTYLSSPCEPMIITALPLGLLMLGKYFITASIAENNTDTSLLPPYAALPLVGWSVIRDVKYLLSNLLTIGHISTLYNNYSSEIGQCLEIIPY